MMKVNAVHRDGWLKTRLAFGLLCLIMAMLLQGCKKEIDFEYNEIDPIVIIEGRVTNEGTAVVITKSRSVTDSVKMRCLSGADVVITADGKTERLVYQPAQNAYTSSLKGTPGTTYHLAVDFEQHHYEASSLMMPPAPVLSAEFLWQAVLSERVLAYEVWAVDPEADVRNYFWYRMDRITHHPHFEGKAMTEPYRWSVFDDRGCPPGTIYRDLICMSEKAAEEDKEEDWKKILYEGDTITFKLMTIDQPTYEYFTSLRTGQSGGANPRSNITGGCQGYFTATSITHADTIVFSYKNVRDFKK